MQCSSCCLLGAGKSAVCRCRSSHCCSGICCCTVNPYLALVCLMRKLHIVPVDLVEWHALRGHCCSKTCLTVTAPVFSHKLPFVSTLWRGWFSSAPYLQAI
jgi:hypothetical protein